MVQKYRNVIKVPISKCQVLIADDHPLMLEILKTIVATQHEVIGTCADGNKLIELASNLAPEIVISDIDMPGLDGLVAARQILTKLPKTKIIFFTAYSHPVYVRRAIRLKGSGYVLKSGSAQEILCAIEMAIHGQRYFSDGIAQYAKLAQADGSSSDRPDLSSLTVRQLQILQLIGMGAGSKQVAELLGISTKTIDFHRANMLARFGARSITELVLLAAQQGLIRHPANSTHNDSIV